MVFSYARFALVFLWLLGYGCALYNFEQGEDFQVWRALYVVEGMQDKDVIETMQSAPYDRIEHDDQNETWVWVYSANNETKTFTVTLQNERVVSTDLRFNE